MMYDKYFPIPFIFGSIGIASIRAQYAGSFVNDLHNGAAVALGVVFLIFTSYVIYLDCRKYLRKNEDGWKRLILPIVGQICSWIAIALSYKHVGGQFYFPLAIVASYICGFFFYEEVL